MRPEDARMHDTITPRSRGRRIARGAGGMGGGTRRWGAWPLVLLAAACTRSLAPTPVLPDLEPIYEPIAAEGPGSHLYAPQPRREQPYALVFSAGGDKLYVALRGDEGQPGEAIAVVEVGPARAIGRIPVGRSPNDLALHPGGRWLVVANRFSAFLSVIDTETDREIQRLETPYYATELAFTAAGDRLLVTNRWLDAVLVYAVTEAEGGGLALALREVPSARPRDRFRGWPSIPVGTNPRGIAIDEAGRRVFVANMPDTTISVLDLDGERELDTDGDPTTTDRGAPDGVTRLKIGAPVNDLAVLGGWLYVATGGAGTGHPGDVGPDWDGDGRPGDGTANLHFHDIQNEVASFALADLSPGPRYSSDTAVGFFEDAPEGAPGVPPAELRIVRGALPEQLVAWEEGGRGRLAVSMAASGELTLFDVGTDGRLRLADDTPCEGRFAAGCVGLFPYGVAVGAGGRLAVANRLSEDVALIAAGGGAPARVVVGDVSGGAFPATDAELGELLLWMTAPFSADGDQSCEHCHRESSVQAKLASAPHAISPFAARNVPTMRDLLRRRPLMFEGFLDEKNFSPMVDEFGRPENFGAGRPRDDFETRDALFLAMSERLAGRRESFGDSMARRPLDFEGLAALMGLALVQEPRLLPNPNQSDSFAVLRGKALFESPQTACAACHPAPHFAVSSDFNPASMPLRMSMLSPARFEGVNIDALKPGHKTRFGTVDDEFRSASLRGLWDRPELFHHDGRARSLLESIATPDHPALGPGQRGVNERDGVLDVHGGTSHLDAAELRDLLEYLRSI